jgi:alpha-ketoglutarate-dependent taurine dioxygenase
LRRQQLAEGRHLHLQVVFLHDQPGPHHVEQLRLADWFGRAFHQRPQNVERRAPSLSGRSASSNCREAASSVKLPNRMLDIEP